MCHPGQARLDLPLHFSHAIEKAQLACSGDVTHRTAWPPIDSSRARIGQPWSRFGQECSLMNIFGQPLLISLGKGALVKPRFSSSSQTRHACTTLLNNSDTGTICSRTAPCGKLQYVSPPHTPSHLCQRWSLTAMISPEQHVLARMAPPYFVGSNVASKPLFATDRRVARSSSLPALQVHQTTYFLQAL
jgi:hypothetical protein